MTNQTKLNTLKVILLATLLEDAIEDLRNTSLFKQGVKQQANRMVKVLEPYTKQLDAIYTKNPEFTTNLFNQLDQLIKKLAKSNVDGLVMINQITEHYQKFPEDWNQFFSVEFDRLNESKAG